MRSTDAPLGTTWAFGTTWTRGTTWARQGTTWTRRLAAAAVAAVVVLSVGSPAVADRGTAADKLVQVIVTRTSAAAGEAERAVVDAGGTIVGRLDVIDGFGAEVPASKVAGLSTAPGIRAISPNRAIQLYSRRNNSDAVRGASTLDHVRKAVGADVADLLGYDGSGVGVAILDTGVTQVAGLDGSGQVLQGADVTPEAADPSTHHVDGYGHGTHLGGIIAGHDRTLLGGFQGVASSSRLISVKAAGRDGSTNLMSVLAGFDWIRQYKNDLNIRVLNLSFGVPNPGDYRSDPLAVGVESLWNAGIVVVAAAGNEGDKPGSAITSPGTDPYVLTVGAVDTQGTDNTNDDAIEAFSPVGTAARRVDVVAPGQSIISLRAPGSDADVNFPTARVGDRFFKGTGTSQAAAVVSGVVADLLERRPNLTPDQVKALLKKTADSVRNGGYGQGAGMVDLADALFASVPSNTTQAWAPAAVPPPPPPSGPAAPPCPPGGPAGACTEPTGGSWSGGSWSGGSWSGGSWSGGRWSGGSWSSADGTWTGGSWSGGSWSGGSWSGGSWSGGSWSTANGTWSGGSWSGGSWSGGSWSGGSWSGGSWSGGSWSGGSWSGGSWSGGSWSGGSWSGGSWSGGSWSGGSWSGGSWSGGSWSGGSWSGGSWSGGSWSGGSWSGGSWSGGSWSGGSWSGGSWSGAVWAGNVWAGNAWT